MKVFVRKAFQRAKVRADQSQKNDAQKLAVTIRAEAHKIYTSKKQAEDTAAASAPKTMEQRVAAAIIKYQISKGQDCIAGYDVLRYAKMGLTQITSLTTNDELSNWYPRNPDYLILRWAKVGQLKYRGSLEEQLQKN
jgi:hypothetical protein